MMLNRRLFLGGVASTAVLATLSACAKNSDSGSGSDSTSAVNSHKREDLEAGGELRIPMSATIPNWNYQHVDGNGVDLRNIMDFVLPYCLDWDDKGDFKANPDFYTTFEAEEVDGKTVVTIGLNEKAVWGNGRAWSSEDIEASLAHAKDEAYSWASTDGIAQVEAVEIVDERTAKVTFESVFPDWSNALAGLSPKELFVDATTFNEVMAGTDVATYNDYFAGPFKIESWDESAQKATLVPNDKWWGEKPLLEKVTFTVLDPAAQATAFANKSIDVINYIISADVYDQCVGRADAEVRQNLGRQWRHFTINANSGFMAEEPVRQAIMRACDREAITKSDLAGLPVEVDKFQLGNRFFLPTQEGYEDNSKDWSYDPKAAEKLLDDAGWVKGTDGIREKDGTRLSFAFTIPTATPTTENEANLLQSQLKEVGIEMTLSTVDTNKYFDEYIRPGNYTMTAATWQKTQYPMANIGQIYGTGSNSNYSGQSVPEIDEYIVKIGSTADNAERIKMTNEVDKLIWKYVLNFPIYLRPQLTAVPKNLANFGAVGLASFRPENIGYVKG